MNDTSFPDEVTGNKKVWLIGDDFLASTIRVHFRKSPADFHLKENFQVNIFCGNCFNDSNQNVLSRVQISLAKVINSLHKLPDFILMILDDDLIRFLKFKDPGVSSMYGTWIEWLCGTMDNMIKNRYEQLPVKARTAEITQQVYWMLSVTHMNFDAKDKQARDHFNLCPKSVVKTYTNMRTMKMKENWSFNDSTLVTNNHITSAGYNQYWKAIDASFKFNVQKRQEFLVRLHFRNLQEKKVDKQDDDLRKVIEKRNPEGGDEHFHVKCSRGNEDSKVQRFFRRNKMVNRYHWHAKSRTLPRPPP